MKQRLWIIILIAALLALGIVGVAAAQSVLYCTQTPQGAGWVLACRGSAPTQGDPGYACTPGALADAQTLACQPYVLPTPVPPTATAVPATATLIPPTATPLPPSTATPSPTPGTGGVAPNWADTALAGEQGMSAAVYSQLRADAASGRFDRECSAAEHNRDTWHSLLNYQALCHYDHQHGDSPFAVNDIFGEPGQWYGQSGRSVAYPWQTFPVAANETNPNVVPPADAAFENEAKHEGFIWIVRRNQTCAGNQFCLRAFRLQIHFHGNHDAPVRYHSFSFEGQLCQRVTATTAEGCALYRLGGWADFARLYVPPQAQGTNVDCHNTFNGALGGVAGAQTYRQYIAELANYGQFFRPEADALPNDELRCHKQLTPQTIAANPLGIPLATEWWGRSPLDFRWQFRLYNPNGGVTLTADRTGAVVGADYCAADSPTCRWTHSRFTAEIDYTLPINRGLDTNGDGYTDVTAWVGRLGQRVQGCTAAGLNCIPYVAQGIRLNTIGGLGYQHDISPGSIAYDYDVTPPGRASWVTWFRHY